MDPTPHPEPGETALFPSEPGVSGAESYEALVGRLSRLSVTRHYEPYVDLAWDDPDHRLDPEDPAWDLENLGDPFGSTGWYRSLPPQVRARMGLQLVVSLMKNGLQFENYLIRGLLSFSAILPEDAPERRYALHEAIEECQHTLMFQEFINRAGIPVDGLPRWMRDGGERVVHASTRYPGFFFFAVLAGEDPIDYVQRRTLRSGGSLHPLLRRVIQIHVTEEARHLCFAREYLRQKLPDLPPHRKLALAMTVPPMFARMARVMMTPPEQMLREYRIPRTAFAEAYATPEFGAQVRRALSRIRVLCEETGLLPAPARALWKALGIG